MGLNRKFILKFVVNHLRSLTGFILVTVVALSFVAAHSSSIAEVRSTAATENRDEPSAVIYQAFDVPFQTVQQQLPELKRLGYTYIQVSPPQKSNPATHWWGRYQPIDHTILTSPLGNEQSLRRLIQAAHRQNLKIIVDVVLNHMANYADYARTLTYPRFAPDDFHPQSCINYSDRTSVIRGWINCDLPDLKTDSAHVRQEAKTYLKKLVALGTDGFRFDAAKHIEPDFFREVLAVVPPDKLVYGEVIGQTFAESNEYTGVFRVTDFQLLSTMISAFSYGGDLRSLIDPVAQQKALPSAQAITFANNHDIHNGQIGYKFSDYKDTMLANAFVLARQAGQPFIYRDDAQDPITKAGVLFHQAMRGSPQQFRNGNEIAAGLDSPNRLFIQRGTTGLAILNKAGEPFTVNATQIPGLTSGCYRELQYGFSISIGTSQSAQPGKTAQAPSQPSLTVNPRDALFLIQTDDRTCRR